MEFDKDDFVRQLSAFLRMQNEEVSERSLEDDYNCIINTYLSRMKSNPEKVQPESNIDCPLGELGLIDISNKKNKIYRKVSPKKETIHPLVVFAVIIDQACGAKEIKISSLQNDKLNIGKIFNLDIISLTSILYELELLGFLKVVRTAGLDIIKINGDFSFISSVEEYYKMLNSRNGD
jgi:hypothetical protein